LRIAAKEFGVSWVAPFLWRLDRIWAAQKSEVPWVKKPPSDYFREHVRLTTQPWEESPVSAQLEAALDWVSAGETLMFSSDYPHHDADDPGWIVPQLPARHRDRVLAQTALEFYGLPRTRRAPTSAQ
jgi:predicted TIM-barrel fold metal-dependent hydrolase